MLRKTTILALFALWAALGLAFLGWRSYERKRQVAPPAVSSAPPRAPSIARSLRPNYPYSIIPGGAYSRADLIASVHRDPVVRNHYQDFRLDRLHMVAAETDQLMYVSYRKGSQVFWTKRRLRVPAGELLLTDGVHYARARCGNRIATQPPAEPTRTADLTQDPPELDLPPFTMEQYRSGRIPLAADPEVSAPLAFNKLLDSASSGEQPLTPAATIGPAPVLIAATGPLGAVVAAPSLTTPGSQDPSENIPAAETPPRKLPPNTPAVDNQIAPVPEPQELAALGTTLLLSGLALRAWRRLSNR